MIKIFYLHQYEHTNDFFSFSKYRIIDNFNIIQEHRNLGVFLWCLLTIGTECWLFTIQLVEYSLFNMLAYMFVKKIIILSHSTAKFESNRINYVCIWHSMEFSFGFLILRVWCNGNKSIRKL